MVDAIFSGGKQVDALYLGKAKLFPAGVSLPGGATAAIPVFTDKATLLSYVPTGTSKAFVIADNKMYEWSPPVGPWVESGGSLAGIGGWADITAVTGSPTKRSYTDATGFDWTSYEFLADGSVTFTEGMVKHLLVGGGGGGYQITARPCGGAGGMVEGIAKHLAGTETVKVGAGAAAAAAGAVNSGGHSSLALLTAVGGAGAALDGTVGGSASGQFPTGFIPGQGHAAGGSFPFGGDNFSPGGGAGGTPTDHTGGAGATSTLATGAPVLYAKGGGAVPHTELGSGGGPIIASDTGVAGVVVVCVPTVNAKA